MQQPGSGAPPSITNLQSACAVSGASIITFACNKQISGAVLTLTLTNDDTNAVAWSGGFDENTNAQAFTINGTPNGNYTLAADNGENTASRSVVVFCAGTGGSGPGGGGSMTLDSISTTPSNPGGATGSVLLYLRDYGVRPVSIDIPGLTSGTVVTTDIIDGRNEFYKTAAANGTYTGTATDSSPTPRTLVFTFTIGTTVAGCTDPEADNYDPLATNENGSCEYSPRLTFTNDLPLLVANGRPVLVTLTSAEVLNAMPSKASAYISVENLAGTRGVGLSVNGYQLVSGPVLLPTNFLDGPSLLEALTGIPALASAYVIEQTNDDQVRLTAKVEGTPGNLTITTSDPSLIGISTTAGVNRYRSQGKERWGCFVEVWCGAPESNGAGYADVYSDEYRDQYGLLVEDGSSSTGQAVLAQRIDLLYRADNTYEFDIAPALRQFTGHGYPPQDGVCRDRLTSYFLKYGEVYATGSPVRRQRSLYQTGVGWALDAVEIIPEIDPTIPARLLTRRPGVRRVGPFTPVRLPLLCREPITLERDVLNFAGGVATTNTVLINATQVEAANYGFVPASGAKRMNVGVLSADAASSFPLVAFELVADAPALSFVNGQGGIETVLFEGVREETGKRTEASYGTPTGTATRSAVMSEDFRLYTNLLTRDEYQWLRIELGNSPDAWYETSSGPQAVRVTALAFEADEVAGVYSLAVDCAPVSQPAMGVTN